MGASEKRKDYISWDEYFMGIAMLSGMRSKDPNTQVGACIVDPEHKILSMGYNGFQMMSSPGPERERIISISILHTASSMLS